MKSFTLPHFASVSLIDTQNHVYKGTVVLWENIICKYISISKPPSWSMEVSVPSLGDVSSYVNMMMDMFHSECVNLWSISPLLTLISMSCSVGILSSSKKSAALTLNGFYTQLYWYTDLATQFLNSGVSFCKCRMLMPYRVTEVEWSSSRRRCNFEKEPVLPSCIFWVHSFCMTLSAVTFSDSSLVGILHWNTRIIDFRAADSEVGQWLCSNRNHFTI
jgi:hypothetical protein